METIQEHDNVYNDDPFVQDRSQEQNNEEHFGLEDSDDHEHEHQDQLDEDNNTESQQLQQGSRENLVIILTRNNHSWTPNLVTSLILRGKWVMLHVVTR